MSKQQLTIYAEAEQQLQQKLYSKTFRTTRRGELKSRKKNFHERFILLTAIRNHRNKSSK